MNKRQKKKKLKKCRYVIFKTKLSEKQMLSLANNAGVLLREETYGIAINARRQPLNHWVHNQIHLGDGLTANLKTRVVGKE